MQSAILRRLADIEKKIQIPGNEPGLILVQFDTPRQQWRVLEVFPMQQGKRDAHNSSKEYFFSGLREYRFPDDGNPRVIIDTLSSPDPDIDSGLFCFDLAELRNESTPGSVEGIRILKIRGSGDSGTQGEIIISGV